MSKLSAFSQIIVRTPFNSGGDLSKDQLAVANRDLIHLDPNTDIKAHFTYLKYSNRSKYRCTPFGLFAGVGMGNIGETTQISISKSSFKRESRLDMHYLCSLTSFLEKQEYIKPYLTYHPNNSLYEISNKLRYVESISSLSSRKKYFITAIDNSQVIRDVLDFCSGGKNIESLLCFLQKYPHTEKHRPFVDNLIDSQIIVSHFQLTDIGMRADRALLSKISAIKEKASNTHRVPIDKLHEDLVCAHNILNEIDKNGIDDNNTTLYDKLQALIDNLKAPYNPKYIFQTDLYIKPVVCTLAKDVIDELGKSLLILSKLSSYDKNSNLEDFKKKFVTRWDKQEIPLVHALDSDLGIRYLQNVSGDDSPLVDNLMLYNNATGPMNAEFDPALHAMWLKKLLAINRNPTDEIIITDSDVKEIEDKLTWTSPTIPVLFTLLDDDKIYVKFAGSTNGANLISRFNQDPDIQSFSEEICEYEKSCYPNEAMAEISHLSNERSGNILQRPLQRDFVISYLSNNDIDSERLMRVSEIYVSVINDEIIFRRGRGGMRIRPVLTSAYNYNNSDLPLYRFICDAQSNSLMTYLGLDLKLFNSNYFPRVSINTRTIIRPASWLFFRSDYESLIATDAYLVNKEIAIASFNFFKAKHKLPRYVSIRDGDNELIIDTCDPASIHLLIYELRRRNSIHLIEYFRRSDDENAKYPVNEFISVFKNDAYLSAKDNNIDIGSTFKFDDTVERTFQLGTEWMYCKFYLGSPSATNFIVQVLNPLIQHLKINKLINNWFFIRYQDPEFHIRLRLHLTERGQKENISKIINKKLENASFLNYLSNIVYEPYVRELERYNFGDIKYAEQVFFLDSELIIDILSTEEYKKNKNILVFIHMLVVDSYLDSMGFNLVAKQDFIRQHAGLLNSILSNKIAKQQLRRRFRENTVLINHIMNGIPHEAFQSSVFVYQRIQDFKEQLRGILGQQSSTLKSAPHILADYIHMSGVRIFPSKNVVHEFVVYEFLLRFYNSVESKAKARNAA